VANFVNGHNFIPANMKRDMYSSVLYFRPIKHADSRCCSITLHSPIYLMVGDYINILLTGDISGPHGIEYEGDCLMGCCAV
jgi:hypothetical protein